MTDIVYPEDMTALNPDSRVINDVYSVSETRYRDYYLLVPRFAPFFVDNFKASISVNGVTRDLVEDVDFSFALSYVAGTRTTGKSLYGGITLHNLELNGIVSLSYQTLGGAHVADRLEVLTRLSDMVYNPRTTLWDNVSGVPCALPPKPHFQDYDTFYSQEKVVEALQEIADAIGTNSSLTLERINEFVNMLGMGDLESFVLKAGDSMEGVLELWRDPSLPMEAVTYRYLLSNYLTKQYYLDDRNLLATKELLNLELEKKLDLTGGALTGPLLLHADPTVDSQAATKAYVDSKLNLVGDDLSGLIDRVTNIEDNFATRKELESAVGSILTRMLTTGGFRIS